jgi:2'-5' RNA ligase
MQKLTQKYVLVHLMEGLPDGYEFSMQDWPLHVTLADVFAIQGRPEDLMTRLTERLNNHPVIQARVMGDDWFGKDKSTHVMRIEKTNELQTLHKAVVDILRTLNATFNSPQYIGSGFKPHSTIRGDDQQLQKDTVLSFDSITLIDMFPNENPTQRKILGTVFFAK